MRPFWAALPAVVPTTLGFSLEGGQTAHITKVVGPDAVIAQKHLIEDGSGSGISSSHPSTSHIWAKSTQHSSEQIASPASGTDEVVLHYKKTEPGKQVKKDVKLRILPVGNSITIGYPGISGGSDGDGYRRRLRDDLSDDKVVFAGTLTSGTMDDGYYAAWSGKTIQYISDRVDPSLDQRPNIILLAAGTNDMNPNPLISRQGNDPSAAADRLAKLIDKIIEKCPDATLLVAMIINTCDPAQSPRTKEFQQLIPGVVKKRKARGHRVLAVDFTTFDTDMLRDCIHPTNKGYKVMGDYWYDFITQIPSEWIEEPVGEDPVRNCGGRASGEINGTLYLAVLATFSSWFLLM